MVGLANCILVIVAFFGPKELLTAYVMFLSPFHNQKWAQDSVPFKLLMAILAFIGSIYWTMTVATYLNHSLIIDNILANFNQKFTEFVENSVITSFGSKFIDKTVSFTCYESIYNKEKDEKKIVCEYAFERYRIWHLKICSAIRQADKCYSEFLAIILIIYITNSFLLIYVMSNWTGNCVVGLLQFAYPYWFIGGVLILAIILWSASRINTLVNLKLFLIMNFSSLLSLLNLFCSLSGTRSN